jgi:hypothetical protein
MKAIGQYRKIAGSSSTVRAKTIHRARLYRMDLPEGDGNGLLQAGLDFVGTIRRKTGTRPQ